MHPRAAQVTCAFLLVLGAACSGGEEPSNPGPNRDKAELVILGPGFGVTLPPDTPFDPSFAVIDSAGTVDTLEDLRLATWHSSDPTVATVSSAGQVVVLPTATPGASTTIRADYGPAFGGLRITAAAPAVGAHLTPDRTVTPEAKLMITARTITPQGFEESEHLTRFSLTSGGGSGHLVIPDCSNSGGGDCTLWGWPDAIWLYIDGPGQVTVDGVVEGFTASTTITVRTVRFASVSAGGGACGLTTDAALFCWGGAYLGTPQQVVSSFAQVVVGPSRTCGLEATALASCWEHGTTPEPAFVPVSAAVHFSRVAVGVSSDCGIATDGQGWCWGSNHSGELGDGTGQPSAAPVAVAGGHTFTDIAIYDEHACGIDDAGQAWCWGSNVAGALGVPADCLNPCGLAPVAAAAGHSFAQIGVGDGFSCGRTSAGEVWCWGYPPRLGAGPEHFEQAPVLAGGGAQTFAALTVGQRHTCGLTSGGQAYCWGDNQDGQIDGQPGDPAYVPTPVPGGLTFSSLDAGVAHNCGMTSAGVYCWGATAQLGQRELGGTGPVRVAGQE